MHRDVEMTVPPAATDALVADLQKMAGVITLSVRRGESVKPPGDVISAQVLNSEVDAVLSRVTASKDMGAVSIATSSVDSLTDFDQQPGVRDDVDEAIWEESETAMRQHTRPTVNFFLTTALGGLIATVAVMDRSQVTEATALVAAAIIAPAFEPLARVSLALINLHTGTMLRAARSVVLTYVTLIAVAVATMAVMRTAEHSFVIDFLHNETARSVIHPPATSLIISACGAIAGAVMVAAGRFTALPGALVALQLLPASATLGAGIELGNGTAITHSLGRLGIDAGMVLVACVAYFAYKHVTSHGRRHIPV